MDEKLAARTERVNAILDLLAQLDRLEVVTLLDEYFPTHGNALEG